MVVGVVGGSAVTEKDEEKQSWSQKAQERRKGEGAWLCRKEQRWPDVGK